MAAKQVAAAFPALGGWLLWIKHTCTAAAVSPWALRRSRSHLFEMFSLIASSHFLQQSQGDVSGVFIFGDRVSPYSPGWPGTAAHPPTSSVEVTSTHYHAWLITVLSTTLSYLVFQGPDG